LIHYAQQMRAKDRVGTARFEAHTGS